MSHKKHKVKVGRKGRRVASAVAVCAISGVMFSGSANAATWTLGSSIGGSQLSGTTYYNSTVESKSYGSTLVSNPTTINNSYGTDTTFFTGTTRGTDNTSNFFSALAACRN